MRNEFGFEVPPGVVGIVSRALAKRPEDRYQTAGELAADLRAALGEPARVSTPAPAIPAGWLASERESSAASSMWGRALLAAAVVVLVARRNRLEDVRHLAPQIL